MFKKTINFSYDIKRENAELRLKAAAKLNKMGTYPEKTAKAYQAIIEDTESINIYYRGQAMEAMSCLPGCLDNASFFMLKEAKNLDLDLFRRLEFARKISKLDNQEGKTKEAYLSVAKDVKINQFSNKSDILKIRMEAAGELDALNANQASAEAYAAIIEDKHHALGIQTLAACKRLFSMKAYQEEAMRFLLQKTKGVVYPSSWHLEALELLRERGASKDMLIERYESLKTSYLSSDSIRKIKEVLRLLKNS